MKKAICVLMTVLSFSALADQSIDRKIDRLKSASLSGEIDRLSRGEKDLIRSNLDQALQVLRYDDDRDQPRDDWRRHSSYGRNDVAAYSDDNCQQVVTPIRASDRCERLEGIFGNQRVWSVSINGQCINTPDSTFRNKCQDLTALAGAQKPRTADLTVYTDDNCSSKLTVIDPGVDCKALGSVLSNSRVWSVKLDNNCVNISDTSFSAARCEAYQEAVYSLYENNGNRRRGDAVQLFSDDSCQVNVTTIQRGDNCSALSNIFSNQRVWSVRFRGQCVNISDTTFTNACNSYAN